MRGCRFGLFQGQVNLRNIGPGVHIDPKLLGAAGLQVILREPLANLAGGASNHWVLIRIVLRVSLEYFNSQNPLFETFRVVVAGMLDDVAQEKRAFLARSELRTIQNPFQLCKHCRPGQSLCRSGPLGDGPPSAVYCLGGHGAADSITGYLSLQAFPIQDFADVKYLPRPHF